MNDRIQKTAAPTVTRPSLRSEIRAEDPREAAAARAAAIREHLGDIDDGVDEFYIDPSVIPDGWTYEWKRFSTFNKEDHQYLNAMKRAGWSAVPASRHPDMVPEGEAEGSITRKGNLLMERPTEIVRERQAVMERRARAQVQQKEAQIRGTPDGTFERRASVKKGYEPIPVAKD